MSSITAALNQTNNEFNQALSKQKGSTLDKDSFMLLLVTQFKYQDPLNPMDDKEFISQMAQFSSLEQMMNLNTSMEGLVTATNNQQMVNATSYIGKQVSVSGNTIGKVTDGKTGDVSISSFRYAFGDDVVKGTLTVRDASGNTVYTEDLAGKQKGVTFEFSWNGNDATGKALPDGVYTVSLSAFNSSGEAVLSDQVVDATVTGVLTQDGVVYLGMDGGQMLPLADVRQVTTPKTVASASDSSGTGSGASSADAGSGSSDSSDSGSSSAAVDDSGDDNGGASGASDGESQGGDDGGNSPASGDGDASPTNPPAA